jgi:hypothetical protein
MIPGRLTRTPGHPATVHGRTGRPRPRWDSRPGDPGLDSRSPAAIRRQRTIGCRAQQTHRPHQIHRQARGTRHETCRSQRQARAHPPRAAHPTPTGRLPRAGPAGHGLAAGHALASCPERTRGRACCPGGHGRLRPTHRRVAVCRSRPPRFRCRPCRSYHCRPSMRRGVAVQETSVTAQETSVTAPRSRDSEDGLSGGERGQPQPVRRTSRQRLQAPGAATRPAKATRAVTSCSCAGSASSSAACGASSWPFACGAS